MIKVEEATVNGNKGRQCTIISNGADLFYDLFALYKSLAQSDKTKQILLSSMFGFVENEQQISLKDLEKILKEKYEND